MDTPQLSQSKVASLPPLDAEVTAVRKPEPEPTPGNQVTTPAALLLLGTEPGTEKALGPQRKPELDGLCTLPGL